MHPVTDKNMQNIHKQHFKTTAGTGVKTSRLLWLAVTQHPTVERHPCNKTFEDLKGKLFKAPKKMDDQEKKEEKRGSQTLSGVF